MVKIENGHLILDAEIDKVGQPSASGKSVLHYSTGGFVDIGDGYRLTVTLIRITKSAMAEKKFARLTS